MIEFKDKVAIITGAASGIGKAIVEECVRRQMKVVLADINSAALLTLEKELLKKANNVVALTIDVSNQAQIGLLADRALEKFGKIHLLFNNAGIPGPIGPIWEIDVKMLDSVLDCNFMGMVYSLMRIVPIMIGQDEECYIVNTCSPSGFVSAKNSTGYHVSKHAVVALTETLYLDLKEKYPNIHVSLLSPGLTVTGIADAIKVVSSDSSEVYKFVETFKDRMHVQGTAPSVVADEVFKGMEKNQFYIFTDIVNQKKRTLEWVNNIFSGNNPA